MTRPTDVRGALARAGGARRLGLGLLLALRVAGCARAGSEPPPSVPVTGESQPSAYVAAFRLEDAGEDAEGTPRTRVRFVMHSATEPSVIEALGTEAGGCVERPARAGELLRVSCWWGPSESHWVAQRVPEGIALLRAEAPREQLPPLGDPAVWSRRATLELPADALVTRLSDD